MKITCHDCGTDIYGCSGSLSFPGGVPFKDPQFHCPRCTERHLARGAPCGHPLASDDSGMR